MSRHHYVHSHEADNIHHDRKTLPKEEFERLYGIDLNEDGSVYDTVTNMSFTTLEDWIAEQVVEEEFAECEHTHQVSKKFDTDEGC